MNAKPTKKELNAEFKRFQRLPAWPFNGSQAGARTPQITRGNGSREAALLRCQKSAESTMLPLAPGFLGTAVAGNLACSY